MIESLRTTQIAFFRFATSCGFFRGSGDEVQKVSVYGSVQEKLIWNHLWEHRFSVPDPRVFPPPGGRFSPQTTESPFYDWAHKQPSNKVIRVKPSTDPCSTPVVTRRGSYFTPFNTVNCTLPPVVGLRRNSCSFLRRGLFESQGGWEEGMKKAHGGRWEGGKRRKETPAFLSVHRPPRAIF